jgi:hypothetical protein
MSDDTLDHTADLTDPSEYEDPVSQRAMAFATSPNSPTRSRTRRSRSYV